MNVGAMVGLVLAAAVTVGACSGSTRAGDAVTTTGPTTTAGLDATEPALRQELLEMMDQDQRERTGESGLNGDRERTERLRAIIAEHGWPTFDLVGTDGSTAAWVIAQHSDQDPEFPQMALELMRPAVATGQADGSELAYLEDRVATNRGDEQIYGTQIRCTGGEPGPAVPIADPDHVDDRRAAVGLATNPTEAWSAVAQAWDTHVDEVDGHSIAATAALLDRVGVRPGDRVLELAAGFVDVAVEEFAITFAADTVDAHVARVGSLAGPMAAVLEAASFDQLAAVRRTAASLAAPYLTDDGLEIPGRALLVSALR